MPSLRPNGINPGRGIRAKTGSNNTAGTNEAGSCQSRTKESYEYRTNPVDKIRRPGTPDSAQVGRARPTGSCFWWNAIVRTARTIGKISPFTPNAKYELHNQTMTIITLSEGREQVCTAY
jgi:hypothetical protein